MKREKARKAKAAMKDAKKQKTQHSRNMKSASAGNSRPSQSNVTQQSGGEAPQTQPTEELHSAGVSNSSTAAIIASTSAGATCWTRFQSAVCCTSTQNTDGHH
jgi:outer membrane biosynthesis protein TonB